MNTPLKRLAAVMFASVLSGPAFAGPEADVPPESPDATAPAASAPSAAPSSNPYNQGTTADGKTIVAPGTYGPFQTPTCEAGSAGCTAATSSTGNDAAAAANNALEDIGKQQRDQEVKKMEDDMVKNGTYSSITRDPSGKGAVITLPNGMIAYSDYVHGLDTMPKTPEQWASDPNAPPAVVAAAKKIIYDQANAKMFGATSNDGPKSGKMTSMSVGPKSGASDPAPTEAGASDQGGDSTDPSTQADVGGMGGAIASNFGGGNGGSDGAGLSGPGGPNGGGASSDQARADNQKAMASATKQAVESAGDGEQAAAGYTYERLAREAREGEALKALRNSRVQSSNGADSGDSDVQGEKASRGTGFFGR